MLCIVQWVVCSQCEFFKMNYLICSQFWLPGTKAKNTQKWQTSRKYCLTCLYAGLSSKLLSMVKELYVSKASWPVQNTIKWFKQILDVEYKKINL